MKAAITKGKQNLVVEEMEMPVLEEGEALLEIKYTGICGTDAHIYEGTFPLLNYPLVPGHEYVGRLVDIKTNNELLKKFNIGDFFVTQPYFSCYVCDTCASGGDNYCNNIKVLGVHRNGSMAQYVKVPAKKLVKVNNISDLKLITLTEPLAVGIHAVDKGDLKIGNTVFVVGAGVIGIMIAIAARIGGASKVVVCDISDYRLNFASSLGFTALDSRKSEFFQELISLTDGIGYDNVFEATGTAFGIKTMTAAAKRGGIIVQCGISTENHPIHVRAFSDKEVQVRGVRLHSQSNFKAALGIIENGIEKDCLSKVITSTFSLDNAPEAMAYQVKNTDHFKVIVENEEMKI